MERIASTLQNKIMSAKDAAQIIKSGDYIGFSGFTSVGYPKLVPEALVKSGHAKDLTVVIGAAVGEEIDGEMMKCGLVSRRFGHQSNPALRQRINAGEIGFNDIAVSQLPQDIRYRKDGHQLDVAVIECVAVTEKGLYMGLSGGSADAAVCAAKQVIVEINEQCPMESIGMYDYFDPGIPPDGRSIPIYMPSQRIGTPYIPCPPEKIAAIVRSDRYEHCQTFKPVTPVMEKIGMNVVSFLKSEVEAGRLPPNLGPIQSGVGNVANAVLSALGTGGFRNLNMYTEVMQEQAFCLLQAGVFQSISTSSVALTEAGRRELYDHMDCYHDRIVVRPQEISNHPEVVRRLGVIALNTPIEVDIYGNVNSTHVMGSKMMNGIGGSAELARNARLSIFAAESVAKDGAISTVVPFVSHVDSTEHDVDVFVTEQGVADLRWKTPRERAELIIQNCAHPSYRASLYAYCRQAQKVSVGKHTPHDLNHVFDFHRRFLQAGTMLE